MRGRTRLVLAPLAILISFQNSALPQSSATAATPSQVQGSWEKVACPFDASKALLPVTCGRLKVPENYCRTRLLADRNQLPSSAASG